VEQSFSELITDWDIPPVTSLALAVVAIVYSIGWNRARKTRLAELPRWRLVAFLAGIVAIFLAISSPLDTLSESLLFMHMAQHFVLMSVAPPLIVLGAPVVPLLRGLPRPMIRACLGPLFGSRAVRSLFRVVMLPSISWMAMNAAYVGWHVPAAYDFALQSEAWHNVEHACFLFTSILFWWPVIRPWPSHQRPMQLTAVPYLLGADLVNTGLSAFLCFSGWLIYPSYATVVRPLPISPLNDQIAAGSFMWVFGSLVFLIPVATIFMQVLSARRASAFSAAAFGDISAEQLPYVERKAT
jgi:putative membrane protein